MMKDLRFYNWKAETSGDGVVKISFEVEGVLGAEYFCEFFMQGKDLVEGKDWSTGAIIPFLFTAVGWIQGLFKRALKKATGRWG